MLLKGITVSSAPSLIQYLKGSTALIRTFRKGHLSPTARQEGWISTFQLAQSHVHVLNKVKSYINRRANCLIYGIDGARSCPARRL